MIDLPPPEVVAWCREVVLAADAARAAAVLEAGTPSPDEKMSGECPVELNETEMGIALGMKDGDALRQRRKRGACEGLYRRSGREIIYSVPLTMAAWRARVRSSPDSPE